MEKLKVRIIRFFKWIKEECKDWKTFVILIIVMLVVYSPTWVGFLIFALLGWKWCLAMATASLVFWAGPFTPFFPLCIAIALLIKRISERTKKRSKNDI